MKKMFDELGLGLALVVTILIIAVIVASNVVMVVIVVALVNLVFSTAIDLTFWQYVGAGVLLTIAWTSLNQIFKKK